jgi:hypothetical protein
VLRRPAHVKVPVRLDLSPRRCLGAKVVLTSLLPYHITSRDQDARCPKHVLAIISCAISLLQVALEESRLPARLPHRMTPHDPSGCACTRHGNLKRSCRRFVISPHLNNLRSSQIIFCVSSAEVPEKQADFVLVTAHTFVLWLIPPRLSGSPVQLSHEHRLGKKSYKI